MDISDHQVWFRLRVFPSEPRGLFPLVLSLQDKHSGSFASTDLKHPVGLNSFTVCLHVLLELADISTVVSYSRENGDNELMISISEEGDTREVGLWIGNEFINLPHNYRSHDWTNYCIVWSSNGGGAQLWINGKMGENRQLKSGYTISSSGVLALGIDHDGVLGISTDQAFVGKMTDVNVWDYMLSTADIRDQMSCERNNTVAGNVFSWGSTKLNLYGGVQLDSEYRCSWRGSHCSRSLPPSQTSLKVEDISRRTRCLSDTRQSIYEGPVCS